MTLNYSIALSISFFCFFNFFIIISFFNLERSLYFIEKFKPENAILSNLSPVLDYNDLKKLLPRNIKPAFAIPEYAKSLITFV